MRKPIFSTFFSLLRDKKANVLVIVGAALPLVTGAAGLGIDAISMTLTKRQLQREADSAAMAAAYAKQQNKDYTAAATRAVTLNGLVTPAATPVVTPGSYTVVNGGVTRTFPNTVHVALSVTKRMPFMSLFTGTNTVLTAEARAAVITSGQFCMLALGGDGIGIDIGGSAQLNLGCGLAANSTAGNAINVYGSANATCPVGETPPCYKVTADPASAAGGISGESYYPPDTVFAENAGAQPDPFADRVKNDPNRPTSCTGGSITVNNNQEDDIDPGCYTGINVKNGGTLNLSPGTYYIDGGSFTVKGILNGMGGVTIVLTKISAADYATPDIDGELNLKAQTTAQNATFGGIAIYRDNPVTDNDSFTINGNSATFLEGAIYMPSDDLRFNGNSGMVTNCLQIISMQLIFSGNSNVANTCTTTGGARAFDFTYVRLVG